MAQDANVNAEIIKNFKLPMPVLAIGGGVSYPNGRGRGKDPEASLRRVAIDVKGEIFPECGHFIPEEKPELLLDKLGQFFNDNL
jgi:pimeloyl-ACP methyl ester carboxylesterase